MRFDTRQNDPKYIPFSLAYAFIKVEIQTTSGAFTSTKAAVPLSTVTTIVAIGRARVHAGRSPRKPPSEVRQNVRAAPQVIRGRVVQPLEDAAVDGLLGLAALLGRRCLIGGRFAGSLGHAFEGVGCKWVCSGMSRS